MNEKDLLPMLEAFADIEDHQQRRAHALYLARSISRGGRIQVLGAKMALTSELAEKTTTVENCRQAILDARDGMIKEMEAEVAGMSDASA